MKLIKKFELTEEEKTVLNNFIDMLEYMDDIVYEAFSDEILGTSHGPGLCQRLEEFKDDNF